MTIAKSFILAFMCCFVAQLSAAASAAATRYKDVSTPVLRGLEGRKESKKSYITIQQNDLTKRVEQESSSGSQVKKLVSELDHRLRPTIEELITLYNMTAHLEGGYYVETYRSDIGYDTPLGERVASTTILFLVTQDSLSHFHRLASDEGWHFYLGDPLRFVQLRPSSGRLEELTLGPDVLHQQRLQHVVAAGDWFASASLGEYSLVGCTVAPGFEFADFEMGKKQELMRKFPDYTEVIAQMSYE